MILESKESLEVEIKSLELYKKDLEKIRARVFIKREKELSKIEAKIINIEESSADELLEMKGWDMITDHEYTKRIDNLEKYEEDKATFKDKPTPLSLYLKMLDREISNIGSEILLDNDAYSLIN